MPSPRDYYDILGIAKGASIEEIKKAYRKLARQYHPDVAKDKAAAEAKMKELNEAYSILSNPQKKQAYDQFGSAAFDQTAGFGQGFGGFSWGPQNHAYRQGPFTYTYTTSGGSPNFAEADLGDLFGGGEDLFDLFFGRSRRPRRGRDLEYSLTVDFADAVRGLEQELTIGGKKMKVKVPPGARTGTRLRFVGQGEPGPQNLPSGDLYIRLEVRPSSQLVREGNDIYALVEISFIQAILGDELRVPVVDPAAESGVGLVKLKVPAGTQPGAEFRLRGKGMPKLGGGRGDAYIRLKITIPQKLTRQQKELLERYQNL